MLHVLCIFFFKDLYSNFNQDTSSHYWLNLINKFILNFFLTDKSLLKFASVLSFTNNLRVVLQTSDVKFNQNLPSYTWGETFWQIGFISPLSVWSVCGLCKWCTKVVIHSWQQHQISNDGCYQNYSHITAHSICWHWLLLDSSIQRNLY